MLRKLDTQVAENDVTNALFELGIIETPTEVLDLELSLRDGIGLDSQEVVSLVEIVSSLILVDDRPDENDFETVYDLVCYLAANRAPWLPAELPYIHQGSIVIEQDIDTVFDYISKYQKWPEVLSHVTKIETDYDDNKMQSFKMHIEELGSKQNYHVQSWRYVNKERGIIDFSQPLPPKGFTTHQGGWRFRALDTQRTQLISYHGFSLQEGADIEAAFVLIRKHIQAALNTWARHGREQCCE